MPEKKIDETVNPKAAEGTQDRVAMLSLKSDGTPDQTNPVVIGDKEAAVTLLDEVPKEDRTRAYPPWPESPAAKGGD